MSLSCGAPTNPSTTATPSNQTQGSAHWQIGFDNFRLNCGKLKISNKFPISCKVPPSRAVAAGCRGGLAGSQSKMIAAATRVFFFGPPGSGKSTLVNALVTNGRCLTAPCEASSANTSVTKFPTEFHHGVRSMQVVRKDGREDWVIPEGEDDEGVWAWYRRRVSALGDDPTVERVCLFDAWAFPREAVLVDTRGVDELNSEVLASADVVVQLTIRLAERQDFAQVYNYGARPDAVYVNAIRFADNINEDSVTELRLMVLSSICEDAIMPTHQHLPSRRAALRGVASRCFMAPCASLTRGGIGNVSEYLGVSRWLSRVAAPPMRARLDLGLKAFLPTAADDLPLLQGNLPAVAALPVCQALGDHELAPVFFVCSDARQLRCLDGLNGRVVILSSGVVVVPDAPPQWTVVESDGSLGFATGFARRMGFEAFWYLEPDLEFRAMVADLDSSDEVELRHALFAVQSARAELLGTCIARVKAAQEDCGNSLVLAAGDLGRSECRRFDLISSKIKNDELPPSMAREFATLLQRVEPRGGKNRENAAKLRNALRVMLSVTSVGFGQQDLIDDLFPRRHTISPAGGSYPCALYSTALADLEGGVHVSTIVYSCSPTKPAKRARAE